MFAGSEYSLYPQARSEREKTLPFSSSRAAIKRRHQGGAMQFGGGNVAKNVRDAVRRYAPFPFLAVVTELSTAAAARASQSEELSSTSSHRRRWGEPSWSWIVFCLFARRGHLEKNRFSREFGKDTLLQIDRIQKITFHTHVRAWMAPSAYAP